MAFKFVTLFALVAFVNAGTLVQQQHGQIYQAPAVVLHNEHHGDHSYAPANYQFGYSVHDPHTGDIKDQQETRSGDHVRGRYSLVEPDGNRRVVDYSSDPHTGFNAHVRHESASLYAAKIAVGHAAPVAVAHAAPVAVAHAAPVAVAHTAPVAVAHAAPVAQISYTQHNPTAITYAEQHQVPVAYAQHDAPIAYTQHAAPVSYAHGSAPLISTHYTSGIQHHDSQLAYQH